MGLLWWPSELGFPPGGRCKADRNTSNNQPASGDAHMIRDFIAQTQSKQEPTVDQLTGAKPNFHHMAYR